jgi:hypothetical protein
VMYFGLNWVMGVDPSILSAQRACTARIIGGDRED